MGKKTNTVRPEIAFTKKEAKQISKLKTLITYHEARGGNRPGKPGDKPGEWSKNEAYDKVCECKKKIEEINENAQKRSWDA